MLHTLSTLLLERPNGRKPGEHLFKERGFKIHSVKERRLKEYRFMERSLKKHIVKERRVKEHKGKKRVDVRERMLRERGAKGAQC